MAGKLHQGTLELFRHDPWLGFDLLGLERPVIGTPIDRRAEVERDDPRRPGDVESNYPDLVMVQTDTDDGVVLCVEAQAKLDTDKRWKLPYYQASAAKDHKLQTWLVVISYCERMSRALAAWKTGPPPQVDVLLLDVNTVARILDIEQARERPTAAVLVAALHGCRGDMDAARMGIQATLGLPAQRRTSYIGTILAAVSREHRDILIGELNMNEREEIWEIERNSGSYCLGLEVGQEQGRQEGRQEGRRNTLVELILAVLEVRGIALEPRDEDRVRACDGLATLERWTQLAREINTGPELFVDR